MTVCEPWIASPRHDAPLEQANGLPLENPALPSVTWLLCDSQVPSA